VDRALVAGVHLTPRRLELLRAVLLIAERLGLTVVAEGVETQAQADFLIAHDCACMQGYLFARPLEAEAFAGYSCPISTSALRVPKLTAPPRTTAVLPASA